MGWPGAPEEGGWLNLASPKGGERPWSTTIMLTQYFWSLPRARARAREKLAVSVKERARPALHAQRSRDFDTPSHSHVGLGRLKRLGICEPGQDATCRLEAL